MFVGRADDQVKLGGRRIELGEIDNALLALPGVTARPPPCGRAGPGNQLLVGYVAVDDDVRRRRRRWSSFVSVSCRPRSCHGSPRSRRCRPAPPARSTGTRCRGRWPRPEAHAAAGRARGHRGLGRRAVARDPRARSSPTSGDDFFDLGGGSLTAAQLVSRLREPLPRGHRRRRLRASDGRRRCRRCSTRWPRRRARPTGRSGRPRRRPRSARSSSRSRCGRSPACAG